MRRVTRLGSIAVLAAGIAVLQAAMFTPYGFFSGDQGSKYLQARAFATHGPLQPGIDVRSRDLDPEYRHQEPKLKNRRGRLVSEFLWLLPLASAPFVALFGLWGLYVVPALSVLAVLWIAMTIGRRLDARHGVQIGWTAVLATPILLYGFEFWEHAPAAACVLGAAALLGPWSPSPARGRAVAAGALILVGALFREETLPALPALVVARALTMERDRLREIVVTGALTGAGLAAAALLAVPMNVLLYGSVLPMHMTQDAWEVARAAPYMDVRREVLFDLLLPREFAGLYALAAIAGLASAVARARGVAWRGLLPIAHASVVVMLAAGVVVPLARTGYNVASAAHTWPFALALIYWPWTARTIDTRAIHYLVAGGLLILMLTVVIVPTSGGAQWSPRFLLAAAPVLGVAAAVIAWGPSVPATAAWMARLAVVAGILMQASGFLYFREAKNRNARITDQVRRQPADEPIVADAYWVPEVIATLAPDRRILFAWSAAEMSELGRIAVDRGFRQLTVLSSTAETGYVAPRILVDAPGCTLTRSGRVAVGERGLILHRYACDSIGVLK